LWIAKCQSHNFDFAIFNSQSSINSQFPIRNSQLIPSFIESLPPPGVRSRGTLVLLHAFPLTAQMWEGQLGLAELGWRVIAPYLESVDDARPPSTRTMDDYAARVIDLLDSLHIKDAVIGGLSMGGYAAFAVHRLAPNYVRGLILADTRPQADTQEGVEGRRRLLGALEKGGPDAVAEDMLPKVLGRTTLADRPGVVAHVRAMMTSNKPETIAAEIYALMSRRDSTPLLSSIHVPTLIIVGDEDTITPPQVSSDLRAQIAGSDLVQILSAGHLSNLEQPEPFNAALAHFLDHRV